MFSAGERVGAGAEVLAQEVEGAPRIGGSALVGLSLADILGAESSRAAETASRGPGWGKAKSVILIFLQGGPSHLDLWDPKTNVPESVRSPFKIIKSKVSGMEVTELLPKLAQVTDKFTFIRSMSYTPIGLFNHTAAIYQMVTGYTADKVSPSGQLEPPNAKDFPNIGSNVARFRPADVPMLPFVMLPRPLQESNVVGKRSRFHPRDQNAVLLGQVHRVAFVFSQVSQVNAELRLRPFCLRCRLVAFVAEPVREDDAAVALGRPLLHPERREREDHDARPHPAPPPAPGVALKSLSLFRIPVTGWSYDFSTLALTTMMLSAAIQCRLSDFAQMARRPRASSFSLRCRTWLRTVSTEIDRASAISLSV